MEGTGNGIDPWFRVSLFGDHVLTNKVGGTGEDVKYRLAANC